MDVILTQEFWFEASGGVKLFMRRWTPETDIKAVVHIVHGMAEHSARYKGFGEFMAANGVELWCADLRGHGKTADPSVNSEAEGGSLGHCADKKAVQKILHDIDAVNEAIRKMRAKVPLIIFGHSWGSFLTQFYIEQAGNRVDGAVLSGTRGPGGLDSKTGYPFSSLLCALFGVRRRFLFIYKMVFGAYGKYFPPKRTEFDWLSRDIEAVDEFNNDPLCGRLPTLGFFKDLTFLLNQIHKNRNIEKIPRSLPLYLLCGDKDPVGGMWNSVNALVKKYNAVGIKDLSYVLYPGARHECLREINREEVMRNFLKWLESRF